MRRVYLRLWKGSIWREFAVQTVRKAGRILNLFSLARSEWGVSEVAKELEFPKSSTSSMMAALAEQGLLRRTSERRYRLGWRVMAMSQILLAEQAKLMESYGADCVYVVDSAGAMLPEDASDRMKALKDALSIQVGYHAHDNLGPAIGNTIAAVKAGADQIDGSLRGLGAGAGNAPTELVAAVLDRMGLNPGLDVFALMDAAEYVIAPFMPFQPLTDRDSITIGYARVYSTFLLHAKRAAERYDLDPREILVELGRRQAVAGQEDWILDVAVEFSRQKEGVKG